ncbi:hypothetical protein [Nostoc sp. LEGE 12450]|nr:hypothetical protein [Nostoc sp. LEGE 12450]
MTPVAAQVSITAIIPILTAIANWQWEQFKELEADLCILVWSRGMARGF